MYRYLIELNPLSTLLHLTDLYDMCQFISQSKNGLVIEQPCEPIIKSEIVLISTNPEITTLDVVMLLKEYIYLFNNIKKI